MVAGRVSWANIHGAAMALRHPHLGECAPREHTEKSLIILSFRVLPCCDFHVTKAAVSKPTLHWPRAAVAEGTQWHFP